MHYHLIGICGTAMASLAGMLQARGHLVTGSDEHVYPPMSTMLETLGIQIMKGYDASHVASPDCVVVGNAIPRGNPEVESALDRRLNYRSLPEVLKAEFIHGRHAWQNHDDEFSCLGGRSSRLESFISCRWGRAKLWREFSRDRQRLLHHRRRRIRHRLL